MATLVTGSLSWIEFESAHKFFTNLNFVFSKSMNLNFVFSKSMHLNFVFSKSMNLNFIFSKSRSLNFKIRKKNEWTNPTWHH